MENKKVGENCIFDAIFSPDELKFWATMRECGSMALCYVIGTDLCHVIGTENVPAGKLQEFFSLLLSELFEVTGGDVRFSTAAYCIPPFPAFQRSTEGGDLNLGKVVLVPIPLETWIDCGDHFVEIVEAGIRAIREDDEYAEYLSAQEIE